MQKDEIKQKPIQIINIFKESLSIYKSNFIFFLLIVLIGNSIIFIEKILALLKISLGWLDFITAIAGPFVSFWGHLALIFAISKRFLNQDVGIKAVFFERKDRIWRFIGVSIFYLLIFIVGSLLFIIPGFYWGTIFALAGVVVILEDVAFFDSFKKSKNLIKGYFWPVFLIYCILFLIFTPVYFIYMLDISIVTKALIILLISILYAPWVTAVNINMYNRLKKLKGDVENIEKDKVNKGMGCLGCLGSIGLFITIIVLSTIWVVNLGKFFKTESGSKAYEWIADKVSQKIKLQDGVVLERPEGYLVVKSQQKIMSYTFYGFFDKKFSTLSAFSIPFEDLKIQDKTSIKLGGGEIWNKYYSYLISQKNYLSRRFLNMEKDKIEIVDIGGRQWVEYRLKEKEKKYSKSQKVWICYYTLTDNAVLFVSYSYRLHPETEEPILHRKEVERILNRFIFP